MTASKLSGYEVARRLVGPFYLVFGITMYIALHRHFTDHPVLVYYAATLGMMAFTGLLEWVMPFHKAWQSPDDQFINEIGSTFISAFLGHNVGKVAAFALFGWFVVYWRGMDGSAPWWPSSLPFAVQSLSVVRDLGVRVVLESPLDARRRLALPLAASQVAAPVVAQLGLWSSDRLLYHQPVFRTACSRCPARRRKYCCSTAFSLRRSTS